MSQTSALTKFAHPSGRPSVEAESAGSAPGWKQEVNERLAAHRNRRGGGQDDARDGASESPRAARTPANAAAARVAARYAKAPSYSQMLAGEARAVVRAAGAAAEAARSAQAAAEAVLAGLEANFDAGRAAGFPTGAAPADPWASTSGTPEWHPALPVEASLPSASSPVPAPAAVSRWLDEPPPSAHAPSEPTVQNNSWGLAAPRWEETLPPSPPLGGRDVWSEMRLHPEQPPNARRDPGGHASTGYARDADEAELFPDNYFDAGNPMASATVEPLQHLPANLIEFPRELVAQRKARPRLAEGPLYDPAHDPAQLSIFEVDPHLLEAPIAMPGTARDPVAPPEWASIELENEPDPPLALSDEARAAASVYFPMGQSEIDVQPVSSPQAYLRQNDMARAEGSSALVEEPMVMEHVQQRPLIRPQVREPEVKARIAESVGPASELLVARLSDRLLAVLVDGALVTLAGVAAAVVAIASTAHPPTGRIALIASGAGLLLFGLLYQFLFLSYAEEGTPGMRYARIALCTFDDDNPTVAQMRMRIPATLLSALPAGLGLVWAAFDRDHLCWHDRLTRTYQRKY